MDTKKAQSSLSFKYWNLNLIFELVLEFEFELVLEFELEFELDFVLLSRKFAL